MKTIKTVLPVLFVLITAFAAQATILFQDSVNYPYTNGPLEGQGQWYCYTPKTPKLNTYVTNNVLLLVTQSTNDALATPLDGWVNNSGSTITFASFMINVSQLPTTASGGYFAQLMNSNDAADCCHVFIDTISNSVPGSYHLGIGNYATSFNGTQPPNNFSQDLAPGVWYNVVIAFDTDPNSIYTGATLWVNPSEQDYENFLTSPAIPDNFIYGTDTTSLTNDLGIAITQIGFSPYINAGISNVIAGTLFSDVVGTNAPIFGIQPQNATNYSGNPTSLYSVASGVDLAYQWYSANYGKLSDGTTFANGDSFTGSTSNILTVNNLAANDTYWCVAQDAYNNTATSSNAVETVITTPTAPFFSEAVENTTNNVFTSASLSDPAGGTGPLYYQWYFAPTNLPITFSALQGQNSSSISVYLADYSTEGSYYVTASNSLFGGSIAISPTNTITEIAPLLSTMTQIHNLENTYASQIAANPSGVVYINTNNLTVSGYVSEYEGYGSSANYTEFYMQDASGEGVEVYLGSSNILPTPGTTNTPPIGTPLTITGELEVFDGGLELAPYSLSAMVTNFNAPVLNIEPHLANAYFMQLITNGNGTNALNLGGSLVTFTNCWLYANKTGGLIGPTAGTHAAAGGIFDSNTYTQVYFTINGPYSNPANTNVFEIFQPGYNYNALGASPFAYQPIPTNSTVGSNYVYQLTGIYDNFEGTPELIPSRLADYCANAPTNLTSSATVSKGITTVRWQAKAGPTYSVYSATSLLGPWTQAAAGLTYYPSNGIYVETNTSPQKFYHIGTP